MTLTRYDHRLYGGDQDLGLTRRESTSTMRLCIDDLDSSHLGHGFGSEVPERKQSHMGTTIEPVGLGKLSDLTTKSRDLILISEY